MTDDWGITAAEAQEKIAQKELAELRRGEIMDMWRVLADVMIDLRERTEAKTIHLLDVGCGVGAIAELFEYAVPGWVRYYGLDTNQAAIDIVKQQGRGCVLHADICDMELIAGCQLVMSNGTLNHIHDWKTALRNMARMAGGWVVLHRLWVYQDDTPTAGRIKQAYGSNLWHLRINEAEMVELMLFEGFALIERLSSDGSESPVAGWTYVFERKAC